MSVFTIQGLNGIWTHNLCITGVMLCQLSYQSWVKINPVNFIWDCQVRQALGKNKIGSMVSNMVCEFACIVRMCGKN